MELSWCLGAADLHRSEYILLQPEKIFFQLPCFHHLASRPSSWNPLNYQPDPTVCRSSPQHSCRSARCDPQHVSADSSVSRRDGGSAPIFHVLVAVASRPSFALDLPRNLFAVIVSLWPSCLHSELTPNRVCHRWAASFCSPSLSSADPPMNCSSVHTMLWQRSPSMPSDDTCHPTSPFPAVTCTSQLGCFWSCASFKAVSSSIRMASSGLAVCEPISRTNMVRSGSAYSVRSHFTSKLSSTSISEYLSSASGPFCRVTHL